MHDFRERIRPIADQIYDIIAAEGLNIYEFRELFKVVQGRVNARAIIPPIIRQREGGEVDDNQ